MGEYTSRNVIHRDANYSNMLIICLISFHNEALPSIIQSGIQDTVNVKYDNYHHIFYLTLFQNCVSLR